MLTDTQRADFERTGLLRVEGAVPAPDVDAMCDRIWEHVRAEHAMERDDPGTWQVDTRLSGLRTVGGRREFERIGSPAMRAALDGLLGEWTTPAKWGILLVTFPQLEQTRWDVPFGVWHNDFVPYDATRPGLRAVQFFLLLNDILPGGGATVVLTGSHRLVEKYADPTGDGPHPKALRQTLATVDPWLRDLWVRDRPAEDDRVRRFMTDGAVVDGVPLKVVELTGRAGDVYFMHCDTFHAAAPNCLDRPRMMATNIIR